MSERKDEYWVSEDDGSIWWDSGDGPESLDECEVVERLKILASDVREANKRLNELANAIRRAENELAEPYRA